MVYEGTEVLCCTNVARNYYRTQCDIMLHETI